MKKLVHGMYIVPNHPRHYNKLLFQNLDSNFLKPQKEKKKKEKKKKEKNDHSMEIAQLDQNNKTFTHEGNSGSMNGIIHVHNIDDVF